MIRLLSILLTTLIGTTNAAEQNPITHAIQTIQKIEREGQGNTEAQEAWKNLVDAGPDAVMPILNSVKADTFQAAWFDSVLSAIAEDGEQLPIEAVKTFLKDQEHDSLARFFAYDLLKQADPDSIKAMQLKMIDDPNPIIRSEAIAFRLEQLPKDKEASLRELKQLFEAARDFEQTKEIAKQLKERGVSTDIPKQMGVVTQWQVIGPFDSTDGKGYNQPFPPETAVDLQAEIIGKEDKTLKWKPFQSDGDNGKIDLNDALSKNMDAAGYAYTVLLSTKEQAGEIRVASQNAIEIFFNGEKIFEREEYHHGTRIDQHIAAVTFHKGENKLLIKVLQNNQAQSWAQDWDFLLRICDSSGGRLPLMQVIETDAGAKTIELSQLRADEPNEKK